jgi:single-stranded DNA-binding protein
MWNKAAEQALATVKKGQEVIIRGTIYQDTWTDKTDGSTRSSYDVRGESIGVTSYSLAKNTPSPAVMAAVSSTEDPWK